MSSMETTWDGLPIAADNPRGAGVVVRRPLPAGDVEFLMLHRHHNGPSYEGDWAWTSPSGSRFPGEPVLTCATRELREETGLSGLDLRPVDLSGVWAVFAAAVTDGAEVVIDPEHDRFEWLSFDAALARLAPAAVVDNFQRGATVPLPALSFRPLAYADLPTLTGWFAESHVSPWYAGPHSLDETHAEYGPRIESDHPVAVHVLSVDGEPAGLFQHYPMETPDEIGIDYLIGVPDLIGQGLGTQAIWAYVRDVVLAASPTAAHVIADPTADNVASIRALEKAGFARRGENYAFDRARMLG
jgi:8-oxo-dGTP pyrophosphatase MutT (NUDIX family)/RimJ/RimL family protein N-acetyltransferase